ncbi:winged helix-turn-helix domain-containing protein [Paenibacillus sediminis]
MKLSIDYAPAYELIVSLYQYVDSQTSSEKHIQDHRKWREQVRERLSEETAALLNDTRLEVLHRLSLLIWQCPGDRSVSTFIHWLKGLSPGEIYDCMIPWIQHFNENMSAMQAHVTEVLTRWNDEYFGEIEREISPQLEESARYVQSLIDELTNEEIIDLVTMGLEIVPEPETEQIILVPQHHSAPFSIIDYYKGLIVCQYPVSSESKDELEPPAKLLRAFKALADANRLKILKLVEQEPQTLKSIAAHLQLAKSNAHYHITSLRLCGMIKARYGKSGTEYYTKRHLTFEEIPASLRAYIGGDNL